MRAVRIGTVAPHPSTITRASCSVEKRALLGTLSRNVPLTDSPSPCSPGLPGSMNTGATASTPYQACHAVAIHSGPVSLQLCVGQPRSSTSSRKTSWTSWDVRRRRTVIARHSRGYASTTSSPVSAVAHPGCGLVRSHTTSHSGDSQLAVRSRSHRRTRAGPVWGVSVAPASFRVA